MKKTMLILIALIVLGGCSSIFMDDPVEGVENENTDGGIYNTVNESTGEVAETAFDGDADSALIDYGYSGSTLDSDGDGVMEQAFVVEGGYVTLNPDIRGTGGTFELYGPEFSMNTAVGTTIVSFDFRYPDTFHYDMDHEDRAMIDFYLAFGGQKVVGIGFKPKMNDTSIDHMNIYDGETPVTRDTVYADVISGAESAWYTAVLIVDVAGNATFQISYNGRTIIESITGTVADSLKFDAFTFSYQTGDDSEFYSLQLDNISVTYSD